MIAVDLFDVARACLRRWWVLLPIVAIAGAYSYHVYTSVQPVYYSQTVIGIAPPSSRIDAALPGQAVPRNGLLDIGGAPFVANMAALALAEPTAKNMVVAGGGTPDFTARMFPVPEATQPIPLVMIDTVTPVPATSTRTLELASSQFGVALESLQRDARVPEGMMVQPFVVSAPTTPVAAMPSRARSTLTIAISGIGLAVIAAVVVDVILVRRSRRNGRHSDEDETVSTRVRPAATDDDGPDLSRPTARTSSGAADYSAQPR